MGLQVGERLLELTFNREMSSNRATDKGKREISIVNMLHHINEKLWKTLFGRSADGLEVSDSSDSEYWLVDKSPVTNKFTSVGKSGEGGPNPAFYLAGIIEGFLCAAKLDAKVIAHLDHKAPEAQVNTENPYAADQSRNDKGEVVTIFVIKFTRETHERDQRINQ